MNKITLSVIVLILLGSGSHAGFLGSQLAYSNGFPSPLQFSTGGHHYATTSYAAPYGAPFATPLPVAPLNGAHSYAAHPYAAVGYSTPPVFKYRSRGSSFGPFTAYASVRSHNKFAFPAPVPSFYNAPPSVAYGATAPFGYSDFVAPSTVVKFGPPITTTTTTYSTTAAATAAVPVATPLNAVAGW